MKARRLSGWARLWIVLLVPVWAVSTWVAVSGEIYNWERYRCNWNGCPQYAPRGFPHMGDLAEAADGSLITPPEREPITEAQRQAQLFEIDREIARREYIRRQQESALMRAIVMPFIASVGAFALLIVAKSAAIWVWRGFRPERSG